VSTGRRFDWLVVGAGIWGATFARERLDRGESVLVIDRRPHLGGNCHTEEVGGIEAHRYGPHIFHTRSARIWEYVGRHAAWRPYHHRALARSGGEVYPFPPGLSLFHRLYGATTPAEMAAVLGRVRVPCDRPASLRDYVRDAYGDRVYRMFYEGYSRKQWGRDPSGIPVAIGRRLAPRSTWDDSYFPGEYQGLPEGGYTAMVARMLDGATVETGIDFLADRGRWERRARRVAYTGRLDAYFGRDLGTLEYRTLRFEDEWLPTRDYQGNSVVNESDEGVPWTRTVEHRHFGGGSPPRDRTLITREIPGACGPGDTPYYPVEDAPNRALRAEYLRLAARSGAIFGGRLAEHRYYDMDQAIGSALAASRRLAPRPHEYTLDGNGVPNGIADLMGNPGPQSASLMGGTAR
jgi:UDP-galactopyranose mutase